MSTSEWTVQLLWGLAGLQERKTIQAECENEVGNLTDGILAHRWDEAAGDPIPPDYDLLYFLPFPWRKSLQSRVFCTDTVQRHQLFRLIDMCSYLHRCCWLSLDFQASKCNQEKAEFSFGTKPEFVQITAHRIINHVWESIWFKATNRSERGQGNKNWIFEFHAFFVAKGKDFQTYKALAEATM